MTAGRFFDLIDKPRSYSCQNNRFSLVNCCMVIQWFDCSTLEEIEDGDIGVSEARTEIVILAPIPEARTTHVKNLPRSSHRGGHADYLECRLSLSRMFQETGFLVRYS